MTRGNFSSLDGKDVDLASGILGWGTPLPRHVALAVMDTSFSSRSLFGAGMRELAGAALDALVAWEAVLLVALPSEARLPWPLGRGFRHRGCSSCVVSGTVLEIPALPRNWHIPLDVDGRTGVMIFMFLNMMNARGYGQNDLFNW